MSRRTVQIVAANGAKIRTVASRRYFVVTGRTVTQEWRWATSSFHPITPRETAHVEKRTDNIDTARRTSAKINGSEIFELVHDNDKLAVRKIG